MIDCVVSIIISSLSEPAAKPGLLFEQLKKIGERG